MLRVWQLENETNYLLCSVWAMNRLSSVVLHWSPCTMWQCHIGGANCGGQCNEHNTKLSCTYHHKFLSVSLQTLLQQLRWLPIEYRVNFKTDNITFRPIHSFQPVYLFSALHAHHSTRSLRLPNANLPSVLFVRTSLGARSFSVAGLKIRNSLLHISEFTPAQILSAII